MHARARAARTRAVPTRTPEGIRQGQLVQAPQRERGVDRHLVGQQTCKLPRLLPRHDHRRLVTQAAEHAVEQAIDACDLAEHHA